jgi:hypothetical protein
LGSPGCHATSCRAFDTGQVRREVEATDADAAIEAATKEFEIEDAKRLIA